MRVSFFTSVFKSSKWLEGFLNNITGIEGFENCELVLYQPENPEKDAEKEIIAPFLCDRVRLVEDGESLPLYETWSRAVRECKYDWVSNANPDDRKLPNFLANFEEAMGIEADIYYADCLVAKNEEELADPSKCTERYVMPDCGPENLIIYNPPHNAPVWRKAIHDEVGWFEDEYGYAGDQDFWLRCRAGGLTFQKVEKISGIYYFNPEGLSTGGGDGGRGSQRIKEKFARHFGYKGPVHGQLRDIIFPL